MRLLAVGIAMPCGFAQHAGMAHVVQVAADRVPIGRGLISVGLLRNEREGKELPCYIGSELDGATSLGAVRRVRGR